MEIWHATINTSGTNWAVFSPTGTARPAASVNRSPYGGVDSGIRTRGLDHGKVALYQLSYIHKLAEGGGVEPLAYYTTPGFESGCQPLSGTLQSGEEENRTLGPLRGRRISNPVQKTSICVLSNGEIETPLAEEERIELSPLVTTDDGLASRCLTTRPLFQYVRATFGCRSVVPRAGLEPATNGLEGRCSSD